MTFIRSGLALMLGLLVSNLSNAAVFDLKKLQTNSEIGWVARDNWVNQLSVEQVKQMLGFPDKVRFGKELTVTPQTSILNAGSEIVDWRSRDGQNWVSPILNQGNCGSCVAYAAVGTLETQMNISRAAPNLNNRYSTDALFACGGGRCSRGWWPSSAASFLKNTGVPDEACMPATMSATGVDASCNAKCGDSASRSQKIANINTPSNMEAVKAALRRGPLVTTLDVYGDFIVYSSGVYKHTTGEYMGGHAVSIVGFDDTLQAWIIRNSWGPDWGDHGFAYMSYSDTSGISNSNWGFEVPAADGYVGFKNLHDHDFLSGQAIIEAASTFPNTTNMVMRLKQPSGNTSTFSWNGGVGTVPLPTQYFADGRYEATIEATHDGQVTVSSPRYFYIVNNAPQTLLSFSPKAFDPAKPLSGRVEFNISAKSSPVPLASLTLMVKQGDKVLYTKGADMVLENMTMGWRTVFVPNGTYTLQLEGNVAGMKVLSNSFDVTVKN